jgi:hypothetical protein
VGVVWLYKISEVSGCLLPGAPGRKQVLISQIIKSVPAIEPMTMPAMAPPPMHDPEELD